MKISSIYPRSFFPDAGSGSTLSALHAGLYEGELVKKKSTYQYSYNGFNAPLLAFHSSGIVVHESIRKSVAECFKDAFECMIDKVVYFPYWKLVDIQLSSQLEEVIMEQGLWKSLRDYSAPSLPRAVYYVSQGFGGVIGESDEEYVIKFDSECFVSSEKICLKSDSEKSFIFAKGAIWFCSENVIRLLRPYVDEDYYRVTDHLIDATGHHRN